MWLPAAAIAAFAALGDAASAPLTLLPSNTLGRCLDGTPSGFYLLPGDSRRFTLTLFGGGECSDSASCLSKVGTNLGSSKYFAPSMGFDSGSHFANPSLTENPGFGSWTHVQLPYCSQDLHMGTRSSADASTFGLYFSGHLVLEAVLGQLDGLGLAGATDILLTGDSAGGIGTWPHADWLAARYPQARVSFAPLAGLYFNSFPYSGPNHTQSILASFSPEGIEALHQLYQPFLDADCAAAYAAQGASPSPCMLGNSSQGFVHSPVFVIEAQTDQVQLIDHDDLPPQYVSLPQEQAYIREWTENMTASLAHALSPAVKQSGAFFP